MAQSNTTFAPSPVDNGGKAREGSKTLRVDYDFSAGVQAYTTDIVQIKQQGKMSLVQSVYIDNTTGANNQPVVLQVSGTNQSISIPSGYQGVFPIFVTDHAVFTITSAGNGKVSMYFNNFEVAPFQWAGVAIPFNPIGTITVTDPILDATVSNNKVNTNSSDAPAALVDRSGTVTLGGTSQQIAAINLVRRGFSIQNIDETRQENLYVRIGAGAAGGGTPGNYTIYPGGSLQFVGTGTINVVAATTGHQFTCTEWN